jgi:hypothetical protein
MSEPTLLQFEDLVNFDASTLTGSYQAINGSGSSTPFSVIKFYNSSSNLIIISYDGVTDQDFVPPGGSFILDIRANADDIRGTSNHKALKKGTVVYAKTSSNTDRLIMAAYY